MRNKKNDKANDEAVNKISAVCFMANRKMKILEKCYFFFINKDKGTLGTNKMYDFVARYIDKLTETEIKDAVLYLDILDLLDGKEGI